MENEQKKYYITTPIYYPSGNWHLGHSYTTVSCDALARYKRMMGFDVFYLTGTDEHGQKIAKRAEESNTTPKLFVDKLVDSLKDLWKVLDISYTKFIRTTDDFHIAAVQKIFKKLYDKGDIYKGTYEGKYCTPCEAFWTDAQLVEGKCPDCGREVQSAKEESYFFRLSKYTDKIKELLTTTDFLQPPSRVNEMVNNFIKDGLTDLAVSRTSFTWGVPVEFDKGHVVYVWIDALSNYITALGAFGDEKDMKYWPCDLHMVGKEIVRFHSIIWPSILMALDMPLPKKVYGHGWLLLGGDKMSKSKGNVVDPFALVERFGIDAMRYFLLREVPFGSDGSYTNESLIARINTDLVNDLGNLVKRSLAMSHQYFGGKVNKPTASTEFCAAFVQEIENLPSKVNAEMDNLCINKAIGEIFSLIGKANKYIDETKPWVLNKDESARAQLESVIYNLLEAIRVSAMLLSPFLTDCPKKIQAALGVCDMSYDEAARYGAVKEYQSHEIATLFPRLDMAAELAYLNNYGKEKDELAKDGVKAKVDGKEKVSDMIGNGQKTNLTAGDNVGGAAVGNGQVGGAAVGNGQVGGAAELAEKSEINIDEFFRTELKVAKVIACEKVPKSDKLLKLTVEVGSEMRTVVSGIALSYTAEEMVGKLVVLVANLKPAKLRGIMSQGMILCATHGDKVVLVSPESIVDSGSTVC